MKTDVGIVVPVYNRPLTAAETLDRVAAQTAPPRRLVIVDDGSTDATLASMQRWVAAHRHLLDCVLLAQPNLGASTARNHGLERIEDCRYVAFLDSDDLWPRDWLERAAKLLRQNPAAVAVSADQRYVDGRGWTRRRRSLRGISTRWLIENDGGIGSCSLLRTDLVRRLGGYDPRLRSGADWKLFLPLSLEGPWLHAPGAPVAFRIGTAARRREQPNLSSSHVAQRRWWAEILEEFVALYGQAIPAPKTVIEAALARRWQKAGRTFARHGRCAEALDCYERSLRHRPWDLKTLCLLAAESRPRRAA